MKIMKIIWCLLFALSLSAMQTDDVQETEPEQKVEQYVGADDATVPCPKPNSCFVCDGTESLSTTDYSECHMHLCTICRGSKGYVQYNPEEECYFINYQCVHCKQAVWIQKSRSYPID